MTSRSAQTSEPQALSHGRRLLVRLGGEGDEIEVRGPDGVVELAITLTAAGPVLRLSAARLELAAEEVAVDCERLKLNARDAVSLKSEGELEIESAEEMRLRGALIRIN